MLASVAIVGFGRFGQALGGLLTERGADVRAHDTDPSRGTSPLSEAVGGAEVVVFAPPVPALDAALEAARPHLTEHQLVLDVGSTKIGPEGVLRRHLGSEIPWCATHPLFGPVSLARGEPLRAVVCPNQDHPEASDRAAEIYRWLGAEVRFEAAEAHDQAMADTHVLAFFLARALLELGAGDGIAFAPPSFLAMARTIEAVRGDAGHLFLAIQRENRFARSARRRLLDRLIDLHERIEAAETRAEDATPPLSLPPLDRPPPALEQTRALIDEVDRDLLRLLARRFELSLRAGAAKRAAGHPTVRDGQREQALLAERKVEGAALGLDPETVADVFEAVLLHSRRAQR